MDAGKERLNDFLFVLLLLNAFVLLINIQSCNNNPQSQIITKDSVVYNLSYVPKITFYQKDSTIVKYKDSISYFIILKDSSIYRVDTLQIVEDWLTKRNHYIDTIINDTNGIGILTDVLFMNRIESRKLDLKLYNHTTINNINDFNYFTIGSDFLRAGDNNLLFFNLGYENKNKIHYSVGFDPFSNNFKFGIDKKFKAGKIWKKN